MDGIIKVNTDTQTVSARELHGRLNIGTRFNDWFARMCEYGFAEGLDFYSKKSKTDGGGRPPTDYDISMDMAKQVCMIQRTPEGRQCRQYLIDIPQGKILGAVQALSFPRMEKRIRVYCNVAIHHGTQNESGDEMGHLGNWLFCKATRPLPCVKIPDARFPAAAKQICNVAKACGVAKVPVFPV